MARQRTVTKATKGGPTAKRRGFGRPAKVKVRSRTKAPEARALPGMRLRIPVLDRCFAAIREVRDEQARLRQEEGVLETRAMRLMHEHKQTTWSHAGLEGALVADEKLRLRSTRDRASAPTPTPEDPLVDRMMWPDGPSPVDDNAENRPE